MIRFLALLGRNATGLLVAGIVVGLAVQPLAALLRRALPPLVFALAAATMIRIDGPEVLGHVRQKLRLALFLAWGLVLSPAAMAALTALLPLPAGLRHAVVIWSASPALISSPAIAFLLGLDGSLALVVMGAGSLLMPLTLPPLALGLLGVELQISIPALMLRLVLFIGGAVLVAVLARRLIGPARIRRNLDAVNGFNVLLLVLFAIAIMDGIGAIWAARPGELMLYVTAAFGAALAELVLASLLFLPLGRATALTLGLVSGNRNMASVWASLGVLAPPEMTLFLVTLQLPIYLLPVLLRPVYRRINRPATDAGGRN